MGARQASALRRLLPAVLLAAGLLVSPASARDITQSEREQIAETVRRLNAAMTTQDFGAAAEVVPPKIMQSIADKAGISLADLDKAMQQQMAKAMAEVKIVSFGMDLEKAEQKLLADGSPYLLIPTETVMEVPGAGKMAARGQTLALSDGGRWYLVRVSEAQQVAMLREVYPAFAGVDFPEAVMEPVEE